jgi:beta-phosphoglucomutase-like phosphatase (HAD superfamily)
MVLVPGLDRLDGSAIAGMPDDLWGQHTQELMASLQAAQQQAAQGEQTIAFEEYCHRYADGTDLTTAAMRVFLESAPPLAVIWDSDGTVVASEPAIIGASNEMLALRGLPTLTDDELKAGFHMPTAVRLETIIPEQHWQGADLAAEFYSAASRLASTQVTACAGVPAVLEGLSARGVALAVVSNSLQSFVLECLRGSGVLGHFQGHVDGEDTVPARKPDPCGLLQAMRSLVRSHTDIQISLSGLLCYCVHRCQFTAAACCVGDHSAVPLCIHR